MKGIKGRGKAKVKREGLKKGIVVGVLAAVLLVSAVTVASAFWYPPEYNDSLPEHCSIVWDLDHDNVMYKAPHGETGSVDISGGSSVVWRAENSAIPAGGVYFPARTWYVGLDFTNVDETNKCVKVYIGSWNDSAKTFSSAGESRWEEFKANQIWKFFQIWNVEGFIVPEGEYLALKIKSETDVKVDTEEADCWLLWVPDDPAYPIPELPTFILTSVGLLTLAGYVGLRRRNA